MINLFSHYYQSLIIPLTILIPISVSLVNFSFLGRAQKVLVLYLIASGSINLLAILQSQHNNLPLLHIYTIVEFILITLYSIRIEKRKKLKRIYYLMLITFPVLCIINVYYFQNKYEFNTYVRALEALICIFYCLNYFFNTIKIDEEEAWSNKSSNWINAGILIYFSSSLFIFIFSNIINSTLSHDINMLIWDIHNTFVLMMYLFMALGFSKCKKYTTTSPY